MMESGSDIEEGWYRRSFGDEYLRVYRHRDAAQARSEVSFACAKLGLSESARVLDLCCGNGRHTAPLQAAGLNVVGLDLSQPLLLAAKGQTSGKVPLVRADMRSLPFDGSFDAVVCFFTSLGYFFDEDENWRVLHEISRILVPGGGFLLDLMNGEAVARNLVPESERRSGSLSIRERRWLTDDGRRVEKEIRVQEGDDERIYFESVRLYERVEVEQALADAGLGVWEVFGNFDGAAYGSEGSSRMIFVGALPQEECR